MEVSDVTSCWVAASDTMFIRSCLGSIHHRNVQGDDQPLILRHAHDGFIRYLSADILDVDKHVADVAWLLVHGLFKM